MVAYKAQPYCDCSDLRPLVILLLLLPVLLSHASCLVLGFILSVLLAWNTRPKKREQFSPSNLCSNVTALMRLYNSPKVLNFYSFLMYFPLLYSF